MGLLENARYASIERGYDYYKNGNVISFKQISENEYDGNKKVCKHKIAVYFSVFPEKAEEYRKSLEDVEEYNDDYNDYFDEYDEDDEIDGDFREFVCDILNHKVSKMTKAEAQSALYDIIESASEWILRDLIDDWI